MSHTSASSIDPITEGLEVYQVGGSVRDQLLGLSVADRDYVVVGCDPERMIARGFRPVGQDFPVFLHPKTHEEYALARLERKSGHGYHGFVFDTSPEVTLEEDLSRRDLTINAMAIDQEGQLIDPYHGRLDLAQGLLRHVSEAFAEDPVRVLRLARFATRFSGFSIAEKTVALCQSMQVSGELKHLVPERVWAEMSKALMCTEPSRFFSVLHETHALLDVWPQLAKRVGQDAFVQAMASLDRLAGQGVVEAFDNVALRFAIVCLVLEHDEIEASLKRLNSPKNCRFWALWAAGHLRLIPELPDQSASKVLEFIHAFDGLRRPERLAGIFALASAWFDEAIFSESVSRALSLLEGTLSEIAKIDAHAWVVQGLKGPAMAQAMMDERIAAIERVKGHLE